MTQSRRRPQLHQNADERTFRFDTKMCLPAHSRGAITSAAVGPHSGPRRSSTDGRVLSVVRSKESNPSLHAVAFVTGLGHLHRRCAWIQGVVCRDRSLAQLSVLPPRLAVLAPLP